jgi:hypothetical protein
MKRAEFIEKWLEALESGEYKQGTNFLVTTKGKEKRFCCLGVACAVYGMDIDALDENCDEKLPEFLAKKLGITQLGEFKVPYVHGDTRYIDLARLNDGGVRFKTIARIIREQMAKENFRKP